MSWLTKIVGGSIAEPIEAIGNVFDKIFTSKEERLQAEAILEKIKQQPYLLQGEIAKIQVQHRSVFVAGARPFIMWVCGAALAYTFLIDPIIQWWTGTPGPTLETDALMEVVLALLGLGAFRTIEKLNNRAK